MKISTLIISDYDRFVEMQSYWDSQLKDYVENPLVSNCMLSELWKYAQRFGWTPFVLIFQSEKKMVVFAPLKMKSQFGFRHVSNLFHEAYPFFASDENRVICTKKMLDFLFNNLHCESVEITVEDGSKNQNILEKICKQKNLAYKSYPPIVSTGNKAIIPVRTSLEKFRGSLNRKVKKTFRRSIRQLSRLGSWKIHNTQLDQQAMKKVWEVEKYSWKNNLTGKKKANKNIGLQHVLQAVKQNQIHKTFFDSEIWFLDLDGVPISYVLVLKYKKRVFFLKTSYDNRYKSLGPGKFLINDLIEKIFKEKSAYEIDFITSLPFTKVWKPIIKKKTTIKIQKNPLKSKIKQLIFENSASLKLFMYLDYLKWNKYSP